MPAMEHMAGNLFLIGMMGAGKSTLARRLASYFSCPFYDSDQAVCQRTGVDVSTIFEMEGENGFRNRESRAIDDLTRQKNIVLATGGGAVLREENRWYLSNRGIAVYLHVQPEVLFSRIGKDRNRPLLQVEDGLRRLRDLYMFRDPIYRQVAHIVIDVGNDDCQKTFEHIIDAVKNYWDKND